MYNIHLSLERKKDKVELMNRNQFENTIQSDFLLNVLLS